MKYNLAVALAWFLIALAALAMSQPMPMHSQPPHCPEKCGNVRIPYPFGIGGFCAWPGFSLTCNHSFNPPRPYAGKLEIIDISVEAGEARVVAPVVHNCYYSSSNASSASDSDRTADVAGTPYLISPRNEFTAVGCSTSAYIQGGDGSAYFTGCSASCSSLDVAAGDGEPCTGLGCCQMSSIPSNLSSIRIDVTGNMFDDNTWNFSPCSYAFLAEKGRYKFSRKQLNSTNGKDFKRLVGGRTFSLVLQWAIAGNGTCSPDAQLANPMASACASTHSYCVNSTVDGLQGYRCNCSQGYTGNPYVTDGCTNVNECEHQESYHCPSDSTCHDTEGSYKCNCHIGRMGDKCQPILSGPAIAMIAALSAIILLGVLFWYFRRKRRQHFFDKNGGKILQRIGINIFEEEQLKRITKKYSKEIGKGNFGEVFMGTIENSQQVAVKRPFPTKRSLAVKQTSTVNHQDNLVEEISIQFQMSHKNLVRLIGCCLETEFPILVFEFIPNGSLHGTLHGTIKHTLSLSLRLEIAIGSAEALAYMHSHTDKKILHGDVKSGNILLDDKFQPKVSDFGLSKLLSSMEKVYTGLVIGDRAYMDPVYMKTGLLTEKSDVYSFGVVLLELVTGKEARYNENNSLPIDFKKSYETRTSMARELFDESFTSATDIDCLEKIAKIAVQCLMEYVDERPTMAQVLVDLRLVKEQMVVDEHGGRASSGY